MRRAERHPSGPDLAGLESDVPPRWLTPNAVTELVDGARLPFDAGEYEMRLARVRERMADRGLDAVLVFRPSSVEYLCGYHTAERLPQPLLVTESDVVLYVPDFEVGRALVSGRAPTVRYFRYASASRALRRVTDHVSRFLPRRARIAVELTHPAAPPQVADMLRHDDLAVIDGDFLVERVRLVLSEAEIRCVERAAVATQRGVEAAVEAAREPDATDAALAAAISAALLRDANSASAWGPTVATGSRAGIPHSTVGHVPLSPDSTFMEFSGAHHRYHAPVMRTLYHSRPSSSIEKLADLATTALAAVLDTARAGVTCSDVAMRAAKAVDPLPDDVVFHELFGYPVGLAHPPHWMDGAPFTITVDNPAPLVAGMVFHIPASFRRFGEAGVGLSQTFVVESTGTRVLTHGAAEPLVL
ncbi:Xaa-Pro peptidase family protein [Haloechinothrix salitolerans]|uniref:Xaa-Pro peptidase family protein n=1 Tax=Haloechinothrix salitolerans TaxID=926830 RepID=A0ABW2C816_9PSEU